nr:MAG TPA: hypothetical protein [Caudoviricetes sp.]
MARSILTAFNIDSSVGGSIFLLLDNLLGF